MEASDQHGCQGHHRVEVSTTVTRKSRRSREAKAQALGPSSPTTSPDALAGPESVKGSPGRKQAPNYAHSP